jgi:hypothetical protein
MLAEDIQRKRVILCCPDTPLVSSPLGLVGKSDGNFRRIHHLSYPPGRSVNDGIPESYGYLRYDTFEDILNLIVAAGRHCVITKRDIKNANLSLVWATDSSIHFQLIRRGASLDVSLLPTLARPGPLLR